MADISPSVSSERQYHALYTGCGLVELSRWSSVTVTGADRQVFLNNFCTNDVKHLTTGTACEAFFTNVKGKIVSHGVVSCRDNELIVVMMPNEASRLIAHLDHYVIREDVQLADTSSERAYWLAAGDRADQVCRAAERATMTDMHFQMIPWQVAEGCLAILVESRPAAAAVLPETFVAHGALACSLAAWETARIEWGLPLYGVDFDDRNFPQEVGRDRQAISFTKGCYLGQETVARIDALGHVNQQLVGVRFPTSELPARGTALMHNGPTVGHVTSAAYSPRLHTPLAIAMVRREWTAPGSRLQSPLGECEVVALPIG